MAEKIVFRAIIEVLGKPKEYVEKSLNEFLDNLKKDKKYTLINNDISEPKQHDGSELWAVFSEVELETDLPQHIVSFCFDFMPSMLEIIEPEKLRMESAEMSNFLNDLQAKLHSVDMLAKQLKMENDSLKSGISSLMNNYLTMLLKQNNLSSEQLSKFTGVNKDRLEEFLDQMIDSGRVDLKEGIYFLK